MYTSHYSAAYRCYSLPVASIFIFEYQNRTFKLHEQRCPTLSQGVYVGQISLSVEESLKTVPKSRQISGFFAPKSAHMCPAHVSAIIISENGCFPTLSNPSHHAAVLQKFSTCPLQSQHRSPKSLQNTLSRYRFSLKIHRKGDIHRK